MPLRRTAATFAVLAVSVLATMTAGPAVAAPCNTYPPSQSPCPTPSPTPSASPSARPTSPPSATPSARPTDRPSGRPTDQPSDRPTDRPSGRPSNGDPVVLRLGRITVSPGGLVRLQTEGWAADTSVRIELHSTPVILGTFRTSPDGSLHATVRVPGSTPLGMHRIFVFGRASNNQSTSISAPIEVVAPPAVGRSDGTGTRLPRTGTEILLVAGLGIGLITVGTIMVRSARQRRTLAA